MDLVLLNGLLGDPILKIEQGFLEGHRGHTLRCSSTTVLRIAGYVKRCDVHAVFVYAGWSQMVPRQLVGRVTAGQVAEEIVLFASIQITLLS